MLPEWYEIPTFYFSNTSEIYGPDAPVSYPLECQALDFELEIACVIGREGKNIPLEEASDYIAKKKGYRKEKQKRNRIVKPNKK